MSQRHEVIFVTKTTGKIKHIVKAESKKAAKERITRAYKGFKVEFIKVTSLTADLEGAA